MPNLSWRAELVLNYPPVSVSGQFQKYRSQCPKLEFVEERVDFLHHIQKWMVVYFFKLFIGAFLKEFNLAFSYREGIALDTRISPRLELFDQEIIVGGPFPAVFILKADDPVKRQDCLHIAYRRPHPVE